MNTQPARGMRDFLPDEVRRRDYVIGVVRDVYERYGFEPIETPAVENIETLLGKYGEEGNQLIFKILKRGEHETTGEADLALRYDLTVPLARVVAEYQGTLPRFFKRYQIQPVWRADRPARGRFREFYQCDLDTIGSTSPVVEAEQIAAASDVLTELGFQDFRIRINHRQRLTSWLQLWGIVDELHETALIAMDKLDKIGPDGVAAELERRGIGVNGRKGFLALHGLWRARPLTDGASNSLEVLDALDEMLGPQTVASALDVQAIENLKAILGFARSTSADPRVSYDPFLARGLAYYTGAIMEIAVEGIGSLGGGGRYDHLIGMFLGKEVPACGFSLGLERILVVMGERNMFPESVTRGSADVMVTLWNAETRADALELAALLRGGGLRVDVYPETDKLGKQFKYASGRQVPFVTVVGDDERAKGTVTVKDMRSGEQTTVGMEQVVEYVRQRAKSNEQ